MTSSFTSKLIASAFAFAMLAGNGNLANAQNNALKLRNARQTATPVLGLQTSFSKINALVSKPGNSQDFSSGGSTNWLHQTNSAYSYDTQGNLTQRIYSDPTTNANLGREVMTYDAKGNESEYRAEQWNGSSWDLIDGYKTQTTYNIKGNKTEVIYQFWNPQTNVWENDGKEAMIYDANDRMTSLTNYNWDGMAWKASDRMNLSHVNGVATSAIMQEFNNGTWVDILRATNLTWHVLYEIPLAYEMELFNNNIWEKEEKYTAVYDVNGGHTGVYEQWNGIAWEKEFRETETYDNNKNYTGYKEEMWNNTSNSWDYSGEERQVLTYAGIDVTQRIFQDSWSSGSTVLEDRNKEVYSNFQTFNISGVKDKVAETAVTIFPNPASNTIHITVADLKGTLAVKISDVTGKTWQSKIFKAGEATNLDIRTLPKGIYMLQVQTEAGTVVKRIVKQ